MQAHVPMAPMGAYYPMGAEYHNGLCSSCESCCQTCWCSCCVVGATEAMIDTGVVKQHCDGIGGPCIAFCLASAFGLNCCYSTFVTRKKLREKHGMNQNIPLDFCSHFWCPCCAICQDYSEAKQRITSTQQPVVMMQAIPAQQMVAVPARK